MFRYSKLHNWWLKLCPRFCFTCRNPLGMWGGWMLGICIDCFAHSCDQVSDRKQLKGGRFYLSSGFGGEGMAAGNWWQKHRLLARIWASQEAELGYRPPGLKPCPCP